MVEVAHKYERTAPDFPTPGPPNSAESWSDYFKRIKSEMTVDADPDEGQEVPPAGHTRLLDEITPASCPAALQRYVKLLESNLWTWRVGGSCTFVEGVPYKSGDKAGQMRPDVTTFHYWVNAHKAGKGILSISYDERDGKAKAYNLNVNRLLGLVSDREMKEWIKS